MLLKIFSHDDGEDDLDKVNEVDQPFGLSPVYRAASLLGFGWD